MDLGLQWSSGKHLWRLGREAGCGNNSLEHGARQGVPSLQILLPARIHGMQQSLPNDSGGHMVQGASMGFSFKSSIHPPPRCSAQQH